jgi:hypothetical protein
MTVGVALVVGVRRFPVAGAVLDRVCVMGAVWHVQDADWYVVDAGMCVMDAPDEPSTRLCGARVRSFF